MMIWWVLKTLTHIPCLKSLQVKNLFVAKRAVMHVKRPTLNRI